MCVHPTDKVRRMEDRRHFFEVFRDTVNLPHFLSTPTGLEQNFNHRTARL
jgi:hypothetical protein